MVRPSDGRTSLRCIMLRAWAICRAVRFECERRALANGFIPDRIRNALRQAWREAKASATGAAAALANERLRLQHTDSFVAGTAARLAEIDRALAATPLQARI